MALRGKLERFHQGHIIGWAWLERSNSAVDITLSVNGTIRGHYTANILRGDLLKKGIGSGYHGFRIKVNYDWLTAGPNTVTVQEVATGYEIPGNVSIIRDGNLEADPINPHDQTSALVRPVRPQTTTVRPFNPKASTSIKAQQSIELKDAITIAGLYVSAVSARESDIGVHIEKLFKQKSFHLARALGTAAIAAGVSSYRVLNNHGRACLEVGALEEAISTLERLRRLEPHRHGAIFYLGRAYQQIGDLESAYNIYQECLSAKPNDPKYALEAARCAVRLRYGNYGIRPEQHSMSDAAMRLYEVAKQSASTDYRPYKESASLYSANGNYIQALHDIEHAIRLAADRDDVWLEKARTLVRLEHFSDAREAAAKASALNPKNDGAAFAVRLLDRLIESTEPNQMDPSLASIAVFDPATSIENAFKYLRSETVGWIGISSVASPQILQMPIAKCTWAGCIELDETTKYIRMEFAVAVLHAVGLRPHQPLIDLFNTSCAIAATFQVKSPNDFQKPALLKGRVVLLSQYGIFKFGGAEQFLWQMAHLYREIGYEPIVVGIRPEYADEFGYHDGIRYEFIDGSPNELLRYCINLNVDIVHVVSGLGYEVAVSLQYSRVRLVFGIHFWRELYHSATSSSGYFPDVDQTRIKRPEFGLLISQADALYVNSEYTRGLVEFDYGLRLPHLYSLPNDLTVHGEGHLEHSSREFVLLANARDDKGFGLILDLAHLLPDIRFVAIASQSDYRTAQALVDARGLRNVEIKERVEDMASLYSRALAVAVPSYRFIETFSRVVVEAQRHATPVVGSDRGNVPLLLRGSGVALPEVSDLWAQELKRLAVDGRYWKERSDKAILNSTMYTFRQQRQRLESMLKSIERPILVGVGSGLGNVVHTTPLIRWLSQTLGRKVDVVVAGDYKDLLFVVANEHFVNQAFLLSTDVLKRRYDLVLLTQSFGSITPLFSSPRVVNARDWDVFTAAHDLHEAEFNIAAASAQLGLGYAPNDARQYFIGNLNYKRPEIPLVGVHAGSKGGVWASKRWPYFQELCLQLNQRGFEVASFGTSDEYVEGTRNCTGGTIEEMAVQMQACSAFVSNDSGVMNLANALGIPLVAIFGPTNVRTRGPLSDNSRSLSVEKDCAPCECTGAFRETHFMSGDCRCIGELDVGFVLSEVLNLLSHEGAFVQAVENV